jgi:cell division protein FtsA
MMKNKDLCMVGLDIGSSKVSAVVGKLDTQVEGKVNVLGVGCVENEGVRHGEIVNLEKTSKAVRLALDNAGRQASIHITTALTGLSGEKIKSYRDSTSIIISPSPRQIQAADVRRLHEEIHRCPTPQGAQIIHALPTCYRVDEHRDIPDPIGMSGIRLNGEYLIVTVPRQSVNNQITCVRNVGVSLTEIVLQPLASSYAVLNQEEMMDGVCLVDIGAGTTGLCIFHNGILQHTAVIPLGSRNITEDIRMGCNLLSQKAERLKISFGQAIPPTPENDAIIDIEGTRDNISRQIRLTTLSKIIMYRVIELAKFVQTEVVRSGLERQLNSGLVLTGGGANLRFITDVFELTTGLRTRVGYPTEHLLQGLVDQVNNPAYATAVGLVVYALKHSDPIQPSVSSSAPNPNRSIPRTNEMPRSGGLLGRMRQFFEQGSDKFFGLDEDPKN